MLQTNRDQLYRRRWRTR